MCFGGNGLCGGVIYHFSLFSPIPKAWQIFRECVWLTLSKVFIFQKSQGP